MDSDSCYSFLSTQHVTSYTNVSFNENLFEEEPINDLELHFNTLFMMEAEKGRYNKTNKPMTFNGSSKCYTVSDDQKKNFIYKDLSKSNIQGHFSGDIGTESYKTHTEKCTVRNDNMPHTDITSCSSITENKLSSEFDWKNSTHYQNIQNSSSEFWNERPLGNEGVFMDNFEDRLTPDSITDEILTPYSVEKCPLPPLEAAFSKHFSKAAGLTNLETYNHSSFENCFTTEESRSLCINNLDNYYHCGNIENTCSNSVDKFETKKSEYTKLFESINYDDSIDSYLQPTNTKENALTSEDHNESGSLMEDLDSLSYCQEDDDDMIGFEEYYSPTENHTFEAFAENSPQKVAEEDKVSVSSTTSFERVCFWMRCDLTFPNQTSLVDHIEKVHVNSYKGDEFICLWSCCARATRPFNARYKLLIHMRVHSGHKPNKCMHPGCGKAFSRLENLKIHRRSHTGERPYRCQAPRCSKAFSNSSDRAKHQRTHFNARPYACQIDGCGKRYTDPSSLRKHVKNHTTNTTFVTSSTSVQARSSECSSQSKKTYQPALSQRVIKSTVPNTQKKITNTKLINKITQNQNKIHSTRLSKRLQTIYEEKEDVDKRKRKNDCVDDKSHKMLKHEHDYEKYNTNLHSMQNVIVTDCQTITNQINENVLFENQYTIAQSNESEENGIDSNFFTPSYVESCTFNGQSSNEYDWNGKDYEFLSGTTSIKDDYICNELNIGYYEEI